MGADECELFLLSRLVTTSHRAACSDFARMESALLPRLRNPWRVLEDGPHEADKFPRGAPVQLFQSSHHVAFLFPRPVRFMASSSCIESLQKNISSLLEPSGGRGHCLAFDFTPALP